MGLSNVILAQATGIFESSTDTKEASLHTLSKSQEWR